MNNGVKINIAGVDTKKGLSIYYEEMDIYLQALRSYQINTPNVLNKIRQVSHESLQDYAITIHGIKGTSANIGAEKTKNAAALLEMMAKAGDLDGILSKNSAFIEDTEQIISNIKKWLAQFDANV